MPKTPKATRPAPPVPGISLSDVPYAEASDFALIGDTRHRLHKAPLSKRGVNANYTDEALQTAWHQKPAPKGAK